MSSQEGEDPLGNNGVDPLLPPEEEEEDGEVETINVDFEGRVMNDSDFVGIRTLLEHGFLNGHDINATLLTNLLIGQNYIGSVIKQMVNCDGDDDDDEDNDVIYGVTSVLNLRDREGEDGEVIRQIRQAIIKCAAGCSDLKALPFIKELLGKATDQPVGFVINQRMLGLNSDIAAPLYRALRLEIARASDRGMPFAFRKYVIFSSMKTIPSPLGGDDLIFWKNTEEQALQGIADYYFTYYTSKEPDDEGFTEVRKCLIMSSETFEAWVPTLQPVLQ